MDGSAPSIALVLQETALLAARLGGPPLLAALASGLLISLVQAITQVNEGTLVFLPKVIAVFMVLLVMGSAMFAALDTFTRHIFALMALTGGT